ncbi:MAG: hypothetical protein A3F10_05595 [Coxiella sp. RIFCSPHIGHO2_12_FULL_42_15]|nr:MAG: hypothetical protein A3F10_05595 [Coxiella sp. RIFCSPHIGHO2_12_FULL_42_15]
MVSNPKISIVIPIHWMKNWQFFLTRCLESIEKQTFTDYEIIITQHGKMAENTNVGIKKATGDIIKILYMDDYLAHKDSLKNIADNFKGGWLATGCVHDFGDGVLKEPHLARHEGVLPGPRIVNSIGSPSVVAFENKDPLLFDENMTWVLDIDYYQGLFKRYGEPTILDSYDVVLGCGEHQVTNIMSEEDKRLEEKYFINKLNGKS